MTLFRKVCISSLETVARGLADHSKRVGDARRSAVETRSLLRACPSGRAAARSLAARGAKLSVFHNETPSQRTVFL